MPPNGTDLMVVRGWGALWLQHANPLDPPSTANYPPWAIVLLAPLACIPTPAVAVAWATVNAGLAFAIACMAFRWRPFSQFDSRGVGPALLFLMWGGVLIGIKNGQFALCALAGG